MARIFFINLVANLLSISTTSCKIFTRHHFQSHSQLLLKLLLVISIIRISLRFLRLILIRKIVKGWVEWKIFRLFNSHKSTLFFFKFTKKPYKTKNNTFPYVKRKFLYNCSPTKTLVKKSHSRKQGIVTSTL